MRPALVLDPALRALGSTALLRHLTPDFTARIGCGVDVDVVLAGHQIGGLRVGQGRAALGRAGGRIGNRHRNPGVLAGFSRPVEMRGGGGTGKSRIVQLPAQLFAGGIVVEIGGGPSPRCWGGGLSPFAPGAVFFFWGGGAPAEKVVSPCTRGP